ncbi:MAG: sigma-70 family RNA polymerase sigma factor [bacterium]|nr:sigma-70 family RNA polymerase sigma factor [bacterium]
MNLPEPPDSTETIDLVNRLQDGQTGAWEDLYRRYRDEMLLSVRLGMGKQLRESLQSEDVLQSVALAAFQAMPRFEARQSGGLRGFLHKLVRHKLVDQARALQAKKRAGTTPLTPSQADGLAQPEAPTYSDPRYEKIEHALSQMPDDMRAVIQLRRFEGLSSQETAERMQKSDDAVRKLYSRAIARLTLLAGGS